MPEEAADTMGRLRQLAHVADDGALELRLAARRLLAGHRLLQVTVDALARVQLRAVWRQVEDLDLGLSPGQPGADLGGAMDRQAVEDEEDLLAGIPDEAAEEGSRSGALTAASSTIQRSSPLLVTAEIRPSPDRVWLTRTSGVRPRGAWLRPRTSSERRPVSSPQNTMPPSALARAASCG